MGKTRKNVIGFLSIFVIFLMVLTAFVQPIAAIKSEQIKEEIATNEEAIKLDIVVTKIGKRKFNLEAYIENTGDTKKIFDYGHIVADFRIYSTDIEPYKAKEYFAFTPNITELDAHERVYIGSEVWNGWLIYKEIGIFIFKFRLRRPMPEGEYVVVGSLYEYRSFNDQKNYEGASKYIYLPSIF